MSEYMEKHAVSRLIGAPPGYVGFDEGGQLTEAVRRRPFRVILFDEIEKAHPDVFNILLQILEDGRLTDGHGRSVDFRNALIVMTSNLGTGQAAHEPVGFLRGSDDESERDRRRASVNEALRRAFRPEFLNRLDEIIIFDPLSREQLRQVVDIAASEVADRLAERGVALELTDAARDWLADKGYDRIYGARPLRRAVQRFVGKPPVEEDARPRTGRRRPRGGRRRRGRPRLHEAVNRRSSRQRVVVRNPALPGRGFPPCAKAVPRP